MQAIENNKDELEKGKGRNVDDIGLEVFFQVSKASLKFPKYCWKATEYFSHKSATVSFLWVPFVHRVTIRERYPAVYKYKANSLASALCITSASDVSPYSFQNTNGGHL